MTLSRFQKYCKDNKLTLLRTTPKGKQHASGTYLLVKNGSDQLLFRKISKKAGFYEELITEIENGKGTPPKPVDGVTDFIGWVSSVVAQPVPIDLAISQTQCLSLRELFSKASELGFDGFTQSGNIGFSPRKKYELAIIDIDEE